MFHIVWTNKTRRFSFALATWEGEGFDAAWHIVHVQFFVEHFI